MVMIIPYLILLFLTLILILMIPLATITANFLMSVFHDNAIYIVLAVLSITSGILLQYVFDTIFSTGKITEPQTKLEKLGRFFLKQPELFGTVIGGILIAIDRIIKFFRNIKQRLISLVLFFFIRR